MCFTMGNIEEGKSSTSDKSSPAPPVSCEYLHFSGGNRYPHVPLLFQTKNLIGKTFCYLFMWSSAFLTSKNKLRLVSYGKLWFWFVCCDLVEFFFFFWVSVNPFVLAGSDQYSCVSWWGSYAGYLLKACICFLIFHLVVATWPEYSAVPFCIYETSNSIVILSDFVTSLGILWPPSGSPTILQLGRGFWSCPSSFYVGPATGIAQGSQRVVTLIQDFSLSFYFWLVLEK
jgi:hypothetical protein